jgi:hypothetical protein
LACPQLCRQWLTAATAGRALLALNWPNKATLRFKTGHYFTQNLMGSEDCEPILESCRFPLGHF